MKRDILLTKKRGNHLSRTHGTDNADEMTEEEFKHNNCRWGSFIFQSASSSSQVTFPWCSQLHNNLARKTIQVSFL